MKKICCMILASIVFMAGAAKAQITDVYAGNDTIELRVGNYQYGFVQWQTSHDTISWIDIEGATGEVYRFLPTEKAYYRAVATFPNCPQEFSRICCVQVLPKVDAGPDRKLPEGAGATMFALLEEGCVGQWEIIEGQGGTLSDFTSPNAYFEGTEGEYRLKWTVTNACGSTSDTVRIQYIHTVMNDNYLVVDTTDVILSDSTQLINGEYIIRFSEPVTVDDSTLLVGLGEASFLRKIVSYTFDETTNTYTFLTEQGTISDFIIEGVLSLDLSAAFRNDRKVVISDRYPTRKDIAALGWDGVFIRQPKGGESMVRWNNEIGQPKLSWTPGNFTLPHDFAVVPTFTMDEPNFMCELVKHRWHVESFKFGLYNTPYMTSFQVYFPGKTSFTLKKKLPVLPKIPLVPIPIIIGPIEITPELGCDLNLSVSYSLGPNMSFYAVQTGFLCNYIMYDDINGWTANSGRIDRHYDFDADWPEYGDLTAKTSLDLKLSFLIYNCVGPYACFSLGFEGTHNTFGAGFTAQQFKIKEEYKLGAKVEVFGYDLISFDWPFITFDLLNYQNPHSIHLVDGNQQTYTPGQPLPKALSVLVKKSTGKPSKGIRVKFETTNGSLSQEGTFTNSNGIATTLWTPRTNSTGTLQAKAFAYNVKNEPVQNAPMVFKAYAPAGGGIEPGSGDTDCSRLSVTAVYANGILKPEASGGATPYLFSTDGLSYGLPPIIFPMAGQTYHFFVRDGEQCEAECYYTHPSHDCLSSDLALALTQAGNKIVARACGGQEPYQFALNDGDFVENAVFINLPNGTYTVTVRDAQGCTAEAETEIEEVNSTESVTTQPVTGAHGVMVFRANVQNSGNANIIEKGFCYGIHHAPNFDDEKIICGSGNGGYTTTVTDLNEGQVYYVRAYLSTENGVAWGNEVRFTNGDICNLVYNGDFELGNVGFETDYSYQGGNVFGRYSIEEDAYNFWDNGHCYGYGGSGLFMTVDGADWPNAIVWKQTIEVNPNTLYNISAQIVSLCNSAIYSQAQLQFLVNGVQVGDVFHAPATLFDWQGFNARWNSGESTTAEIIIIDLNSNADGNDFGLDDICIVPISK